MPTLVGTGDVVRVYDPPGEARALTRESLPSAMVGSGGAEPSAISPAAASRVGIVYACVRLLVHAATPLPLKTYRAGSERVDAQDARLAALLARPWPGGSTPDLVGSILTSALLHGDAFVGVYGDAQGRPAGLGLFDPSTIEVRLRGDRVVYVHMSSRGVVELDGRDVIHVRAPMAVPGSLRGLSPVRQLAVAMGEARVLASSAVEFAEKAPRPGLLVRLDPQKKSAQPEREALREEIERRYSGDGGRGGVVLLGGGVEDVQTLKLGAPEAAFLANRQFAAGEIARAFGVPASLLDLPSNGSLNYANSESRSADLLRYGLEAWLVAIERAVSGHPIARGIEARFDRRALLRPDTATRAQVYAQALDPGRGWMTRAEVRAAEDLPPEPADEAGGLGV